LEVDSAHGRGAAISVSFPVYRRQGGENGPRLAPVDRGALG
jgi:hypothetical protein